MVLVDKPTDLIIQRGCCEIMLFDQWEFQDLKIEVLYHILGHFWEESSLTYRLCHVHKQENTHRVSICIYIYVHIIY